MSSRLLGGLLLTTAACGAGVQAEPTGAPAASGAGVKAEPTGAPAASGTPPSPATVATAATAAAPPEEPAVARLRALDVFEIGPAGAESGEASASARREKLAAVAEAAARGAASACGADPNGERAKLDPAVVKVVEQDLEALRALKIVDVRALIGLNAAQSTACYAGKEAQRPCVERVTRVCERAGKLHAIVQATTAKAP